MPAAPAPFPHRLLHGRRRRLRACALAGLLAAAVLGADAPANADTGSAGAAAASAGAATVLERGVRGPAVEALQRRLRIRADGVFGRATKRAVRRFQRAHRLVADGVVGPATAAALGLALAPPTAASADVLLDRIAQCESGGDPAAVSPDGTHRGKYQFTRETWTRLGGAGDPAVAPEAEQDSRAAVLLALKGTAPWPSCA